MSRDHVFRGVRDIVHRFGLHVTTTPTQEVPIPTQNPYDRRRDRADQAQYGEVRSGVSYGEAVRLAGFAGAIVLDDLNAMVANATMRARQDEREDADIRVNEAIRDEARRAWDSGHEAGERDGRHELLSTIEERFVGGARERAAELGEVLKRFEARPRDVTKADMALALDQARGLLRELVKAHRQSFEAEIPF